MPHIASLAAVLVFAAASTAALAAEPSQIRGLAASCTNCHGTNGQAKDGMEPLAGKAKDETLKKLLDFKTGKKPASIMHQLSKGYTDEELDRIAEYYAAQKK
jgi:sulfide dehydrogenase cytochrome subunit